MHLSSLAHQAASRRVLPSWVACALAAALAACGGSTPEAQGPQSLRAELDGAPKWVTGDCAAQLGGDKKMLCGVGSVAGMTNPSLARSAAEARGRTEIARNLQVKVGAMLKDYQAAVQGGAGNKTASEQVTQDTAKQVTSMTISGTHLEDSWISNSGTFYALIVLDAEAFKGAVGNMTQLDEAVRAAITARADKAFGELDAATTPAATN